MRCGPIPSPLASPLVYPSVREGPASRASASALPCPSPGGASSPPGGTDAPICSSISLRQRQCRRCLGDAQRKQASGGRWAPLPRRWAHPLADPASAPLGPAGGWTSPVTGQCSLAHDRGATRLVRGGGWGGGGSQQSQDRGHGGYRWQARRCKTARARAATCPCLAPLSLAPLAAEPPHISPTAPLLVCIAAAPP